MGVVPRARGRRGWIPAGTGGSDPPRRWPRFRWSRRRRSSPRPGSTAIPGVAQAPVAPPVQTGPRFLSVRIDGPLEAGLVSGAGTDTGPALTQVVKRVLVWWIAVPADLRKGDLLEVVYEPQPGQEPLVSAVRLQSAKAGRTFEAYRFKPAGATVRALLRRRGERPRAPAGPLAARQLGANHLAPEGRPEAQGRGLQDPGRDAGEGDVRRDHHRERTGSSAGTATASR